MLAAALVFSYDIPNYHKLSGLKQHTNYYGSGVQAKLSCVKEKPELDIVKAVKTDSTQDY